MADPNLTWLLNNVIGDLYREGVLAITTKGLHARCVRYPYHGSIKVNAAKLATFGLRQCPRPLLTAGAILWVEYSASVWSWKKMTKRAGTRSLKEAGKC